VKAKDSVLVLELMHFAEELADADRLHIPKKLEVGKRELDMAKALVDSMSSKWDPKKYRDDYREALMEVIEEKVEAGGKEIEEKPKTEATTIYESDRSRVGPAGEPEQDKKIASRPQEFSRNASKKGRVILSIAAALSAAHAI